MVSSDDYHNGCKLLFSGQNGEQLNDIENMIAKTVNIESANEWIDKSHTELLFGLNLRKWTHVGLLGLTTFESLL